MNRVALNADDKLARDWFCAEVTKYGCTTTVDAMGNIFAVRPGTSKKALPPIAIGSHLDTQPTGGKYDGILGVVCGLEVLKVLHENKVETYAPFAVINWTNEEGARFPQAMVSSGVWAGEFTLDFAHALKDDNGISIRDELEKIGYLGTTPCNWETNPLLAHFEVHIEQGPLLDKAEKPSALVKGVESIQWHFITLTGTESHTGSTPMDDRKDALLGASRAVVAINHAVTCKDLESGKLGARATVAWIQSSPQSLNTIAGKVKLGLDLRAETDDDMEVVLAQCQKDVKEVAEELGLELKMEHSWTSKAMDFNATMVECVRASAKEEEGCDMELVSHIGHDR
jgi:hydantoinase/carbamoylase family amidase